MFLFTLTLCYYITNLGSVSGWMSLYIDISTYETVWENL